MVFNRGTRGQSSGTCRQESAWTNEKTIWGELAYWHQAWRQREAVRGNSPNDRSLWTAAHYYNSCPFSVMYCIPSPTCLFYCLSFFPSSLLCTRVLHHSSLSFYYVGCDVPKENRWVFFFYQKQFLRHPPAISPSFSLYNPPLLFLLNNYPMIHWSRVKFNPPPWLKCIVSVLSSEQGHLTQLISSSSICQLSLLAQIITAY